MMVDRYLFSGAEPQPQYNAETISIRNLYNDRSLYDNYPKFQRGFVWPEKYKLAFIDSILRGDPIHPLLTYKRINEEGVEKYWVIDGQQRLRTVYQFIKGGFATATIAKSRKNEPSSLVPIEPGRRFTELSDRARNLFYAYKFIINVIDGADEKHIEMLFRRIQHQLPLKAAEKLASYTSKAKDHALQLQSNPIWSDCYTGKEEGKETFQGSMSLIALELAQGYASLSSPRLSEFASGAKDSQVTQSLYDAIEARLGVVMHVFAETTFTHRTALIPMYQAVMLIERQGYTFVSSDKGCFTPWFGQVLHEANQTRRHGFAHPIAELININRQQPFWDIHLPNLCKLVQGKDASVFEEVR